MGTNKVQASLKVPIPPSSLALTFGRAFFLHCTVMPKTRWERLSCNKFRAWRSHSTCPKLEASVQLAASPGLLLCWVD